MASFFNDQLDFILFFYGLAFILLGVTCVGIARGSDRGGGLWAILGLFGFVHGASEWLDLTALIVGDAPAFASSRIVIMTVSFLLLTEFARLKAVRLGLKAPGRWVYVPLILLVMLGGAAGGLSVAGALARYGIGFVGAVATAGVFAVNASSLSGGSRRFAIFAAAGFALYGIAAGVVVPEAAFWPANVVNYDWFVRVAGVPVQLVRGILACFISFSIWAFWKQQLILEVASERYAEHLRRQLIWTLIAMATVLVLGWVLTDFLGGLYRQSVEAEARGDLDLLVSRLDGETGMVDGMVQVLAGSPALPPLLVGGGRQERAQANSILDMHVAAARAKAGYILDWSGTLVAAFEPSEMGRSDSVKDSLAVLLNKSIAGEPGRSFAFDNQSGSVSYFASYPVRTAHGDIVGVAVLQKSIGDFSVDLRRFDRPYFLIDSDGVVAQTNRSDMMRRPLWPLSATKIERLSQQFGTVDDRPAARTELVDATWPTVNGQRDFVRRRYVNHSDWSLVILKPTREIFASRFFGIVITFLVALATLIYILGRERGVHDSVQTENWLKLQDLARDLGFLATTDPLTGLSNRIKFDQEFDRALSMALRYKTPLTLVLYDVDHFKTVNDGHGHQTGDAVLVQLSRFIAGRVRSTDLLARWGGEEFVILAPGIDGPAAYQFAEDLRRAISELAFDGVKTLTCSFGVAEYVHGDTSRTLIARADQALYRAKMSGRNRVELASLPPQDSADLASVA
jgi:diguanylate cyclase (GGDEF)-like protein